jgi:hypothetical protein
VNCPSRPAQGVKPLARSTWEPGSEHRSFRCGNPPARSRLMLTAPPGAKSPDSDGCQGPRRSVLGGLFCAADRDPPQGWARYPNLQRRPPAPNADLGRLQRQTMRAFTVGGAVLSSTAVYDWCFPRDRTRARSQAARWSVRRVLMRIAEPIGRAAPPFARSPAGGSAGHRPLSLF